MYTYKRVKSIQLLKFYNIKIVNYNYFKQKKKLNKNNNNKNKIQCCT